SIYYGPFHTTADAPSIAITDTVAPGSKTSPTFIARAVHTSPPSFTRPADSETCPSTVALLPGSACTLVRVGGSAPNFLRSTGRTPANSTSVITPKTNASTTTGKSVAALNPAVPSAATPSISSVSSPTSTSAAASNKPATSHAIAAT